jgi:hypothetical protein
LPRAIHHGKDAAGWPLAKSPNRDCRSDWEPSAEDFAILSSIIFKLLSCIIIVHAAERIDFMLI